jgi:Mrp family chromosome partitioning ATPase
MELVRELAEPLRLHDGVQPERVAIPLPRPVDVAPSIRNSGHEVEMGETESVVLSPSHLESRRIVSFDGADGRSWSFDTLRSHALHEMKEKNWQVLGVTSPTPRCGKTVTAINLALSMARPSERNVLLVDLDLRKPDVAENLGLIPRHGLLDYFDGKATLQEVIVRVEIGSRGAFVLPSFRSSPNSSGKFPTSQITSLMQQLRSEFRDSIIILDMPSVLLADDAMQIMQHVDCALLVAAVRHSSTSEIAACKNHLDPTKLLCIVVKEER